jgi:MFS family permease
MRFVFILSLALLFSYLFFDAYPGLNWFLFVLATVISMFFLYRDRFQRLTYVGAAGVLLSAVSVVVHPSGWTFVVSLIWCGFFVSASSSPQLRSAFTLMLQTAAQALLAGINTLRELFHFQKGSSSKLGKYLRYYYFMAPVLIILLFIWIYSGANPWFESYLGNFSAYMQSFFVWVKGTVNMQWLALFVLGLVMSIYALTPAAWEQLKQWESKQQETMLRQRQPVLQGISLMGLKHEWRSAVFLLFGLNLLLLILNAFDLWYVWVGFEWNGDYLKQFVHEGTWLLVLSIFISIAITLYYYRGNLNFYNSPLLKKLTIIWIAQNGFLTLSVVRRNLYYIEYFNLAYLRIAVMFFLALVLFGLVTVLWKVLYKKRLYYLLRLNSMAVLVVFLLSASISWDPFIARYNMAHADSAFVHFDFLIRMNFESFPYLDLPLERLKEIEAKRNERFPDEPFYMTAEQFHARLQERMKAFAEYQPERSWKEWNWADHRTEQYVNARLKAADSEQTAMR